MEVATSQESVNPKGLWLPSPMETRPTDYQIGGDNKITLALHLPANANAHSFAHG